MAWSTPKTWAPGEVVTAAALNTNMRDNMNDLNTRIDANASAITTLQGLMSTAQGDITALENDVDSLDAAILALPTPGEIFVAKGTGSATNISLTIPDPHSNTEFALYRLVLVLQNPGSISPYLRVNNDATAGQYTQHRYRSDNNNSTGHIVGNSSPDAQINMCDTTNFSGATLIEILCGKNRGSTYYFQARGRISGRTSSGSELANWEFAGTRGNQSEINSLQVAWGNSIFYAYSLSEIVLA